MPASQAQETRIPRQIQRRVASAVARYVPAEPDASAAAVTDPATAPAAPAATPAEPAADPRENDPSYWKQRFKVTEGMLARERELRQQEQERLTRQVTELQTQTRTLQAAAPAAPIVLTDYYTPEEIEKWGEEQCEAMIRGALRAAKKTTDERVAAEVQPLREQQERDAQTAAERSKQQFLDQIEKLCPGFDDTDQRWRDWLTEIDPQTDAPRQAVLNIHIAAQNAAGCAKVIKAWQASLQVPKPPITPSGSGATPGAGDATPPSAEAVSALTAPTGEEVRDFYKRAALNQVKDAERVAFEARMKLRAKASRCRITSDDGDYPILSGEQK